MPIITVYSHSPADKNEDEINMFSEHRELGVLVSDTSHNIETFP